LEALFGDIEAKSAETPEKPGVYIMKDNKGAVLI
jgi:excinuclease UvrABC nuclease subunit